MQLLREDTTLSIEEYRHKEEDSLKLLLEISEFYTAIEEDDVYDLLINCIIGISLLKRLKQSYNF